MIHDHLHDWATMSADEDCVIGLKAQEKASKLTLLGIIGIVLSNFTVILSFPIPLIAL